MAHSFNGKDQAEQSTAQEAGPRTRLLPETAWAREPMPSGIPPEGTVVVTISRQFGSGGSEIGHLVAKEQGFQYLDNEIITEVAKRLGKDVEFAARQDEQTAGMVGHILEAVRANNPFTMHYRALLEQTSRERGQAREQAYLHLTQKVILELATRGNAVIVGRGSQFLLHNAPRTLHVYIYAPLSHRIDYTMREFHLNYEQAAHLVERRDYEHESYLRHYYNDSGQQFGQYHLLMNTGLFSFEQAADLICHAISVFKQ